MYTVWYAFVMTAYVFWSLEGNKGTQTYMARTATQQECRWLGGVAFFFEVNWLHLLVWPLLAKQEI
jgi:hypothetical protein